MIPSAINPSNSHSAGGARIGGLTSPLKASGSQETPDRKGLCTRIRTSLTAAPTMCRACYLAPSPPRPVCPSRTSGPFPADSCASAVTSSQTCLPQYLPASFRGCITRAPLRPTSVPTPLLRGLPSHPLQSVLPHGPAPPPLSSSSVAEALTCWHVYGPHSPTSMCAP